MARPPYDKRRSQSAFGNYASIPEENSQGFPEEKRGYEDPNYEGPEEGDMIDFRTSPEKLIAGEDALLTSASAQPYKISPGTLQRNKEFEELSRAATAVLSRNSQILSSINPVSPPAHLRPQSRVSSEGNRADIEKARAIAAAQGLSVEEMDEEAILRLYLPTPTPPNKEVRASEENVQDFDVLKEVEFDDDRSKSAEAGWQRFSPSLNPQLPETRRSISAEPAVLSREQRVDERVRRLPLTPNRTKFEFEKYDYSTYDARNPGELKTLEESQNSDPIVLTRKLPPQQPSSPSPQPSSGRVTPVVDRSNEHEGK